MKVGIVTPRYPPNSRGGGERSVQLLAEQLQGRTDVSVEVLAFDGNATEEVHDIMVRRQRTFPTIPELRSLGAFPRLWGDVAEYDVLHGYNMELHPAIGALTNHKSVASVAHLNSYTYVNKRRLGMKVTGGKRLYNDIVRPTAGVISRRMISHIDSLIALSDAVKSIYEADQGIDTEIVKITNMIDPGFTPEQVSYEHLESSDLLYVGALDDQKGVEYLIRSLTQVPDEAILTIVGNGSQQQQLQRLSRELGLQSRVDFVGYVPYEEITRYYEQADVFVHPGTWPEPLNRTLLEAMQHGLAVVTTDRGGPPEVVQDPNLIAPPGDPSALADSIHYAIEQRMQLGRAHRSYVRKHHHPSNVVADIVDLYETVTARY